MREALRAVVRGYLTAIRYPRVWLTAWLLVTVPALIAVYPVTMAIHDALGPHPGASDLRDMALDLDFAREHPGAAVPLTGAALFALLAFAFLAGGALTRVGTGSPFRYRGMLADGARLLARNFRVLVVGIAVCALVFWGTGALDRWIREDLVYESSPGTIPVLGWRSPWLSLEVGLELLRWLWGFLFLCVLFISKAAMANLAVLGRRSALRAWLRETGRALRHPLRHAVLVLAWAIVLLAGVYLCGEATVHLLEVKGELWWGLAAGQAAIVWMQISFLAALLAVRTVAAPLPAREAALDSDRDGEALTDDEVRLEDESGPTEARHREDRSGDLV